ncbi:MAG: Transcriptional regulator, LacI family [uncultured Frankineae bacterium]|uniref:Transcriptional regulator, LacI family n=1 Tax=uncultured Frankineae bacterium TaxID=437475 RepID=A0A6J4M780_9ACTN|nr:MAG: Transcriptional regulator, LacI family [uncultured Frankineae bacterium]
MAVSMRDVAARAGVSPRTVSNVVSGYVHVSPDTRARVQTAIDELKYRPNISAQSLRQGRTGIIGLAVPEIAAPYFAELADLVQRAAADRGVTLLIEQTGASRDRELLVLDGYHSNVIDGLILSPMAITAADLQTHALEIPTVLLGERIDEGGGVLHVAIDNVAAAREATTHLLQLGRRRIAAVGTNLTADGVGPARRRLHGFREALREHGLVPAPELEVTTGGRLGWAHGPGYAAVDALLSSGVEVDAMFCFNDVLALSAIRAVRAHGLRVPDDIAIVGWDDIAEAAYFTPSLTSVRPDKAAIARTAIDRLLTLVAGEAPTDEQITCDYRLVLRESTAA